MQVGRKVRVEKRVSKLRADASHVPEGLRMGSGLLQECRWFVRPADNGRSVHLVHGLPLQFFGGRLLKRLFVCVHRPMMPARNIVVSGWCYLIPCLGLWLLLYVLLCAFSHPHVRELESGAGLVGLTRNWYGPLGLNFTSEMLQLQCGYPGRSLLSCSQRAFKW